MQAVHLHPRQPPQALVLVEELAVEWAQCLVIWEVLVASEVEAVRLSFINLNKNAYLYPLSLQKNND